MPRPGVLRISNVQILFHSKLPEHQVNTKFQLQSIHWHVSFVMLMLKSHTLIYVTDLYQHPIQFLSIDSTVTAEKGPYNTDIRVNKTA